MAKTIAVFVVLGLGFVGIVGMSLMSSRARKADVMTEGKGIINQVPMVWPTQAAATNSESETAEVGDGTASQELPMVISSPANGATVRAPSVVVKGKTTPRAEVVVNEAELVANAAGDFSTAVALDEGENYILVFANDDDGNFSEKEILITYEAN